MDILFASSGGLKRGSWLIRGEQLAEAMGARAAWNPSRDNIASADLVVAVKRLAEPALDWIRAQRKPLVLDVLDGWPQPTGNAWSREAAIDWMGRRIEAFRADLVVWPTEAMRDDFAGHGWAGFTLHHHARPGQARNPIRPTVATVGYEGAARYLEGWREAIERSCAARGWRFVIDPGALAGVDIVLAGRGGPWRGYATDRWKSNVKLANAQATGTPIVCLGEAGYRETRSGGEYWIDRPGELSAAFDELASPWFRRRSSDRLLNKAEDVAIATVAARYRRTLETWANGAHRDPVAA